MKIWAKTVLDEKIQKDIIFEYEDARNESEYVAVLQEICGLLDIPTPISTRVNFNHFVLFNNTRYKARDFVESIDFDLLDIEAVPDKSKEKRQ